MKNYMLVFVFVLFPAIACAQSVSPGGAPVSSPPVTQLHPVIPDMPGPDACNPPTQLIGQPKTVVNTMHFNGPVRMLGPDSMSTMDYAPRRLNIIYDEKGIIRSVRCG